ncbi:MAG: hypothetical protein J6M43_07720 [Neisseriaceae bacterium]|nr:hypothetical protein [Neisseriaceae bacterium]
MAFCKANQRLWQNWIATILLTQNLTMTLECFRQPETLEKRHFPPFIITQ